MKTLSFNFDSPSNKDKAVKEVVKVLAKHGANVVTSEVDQRVLKKAGVAYRNVMLTFADGQTATLAFKETGDVFEIRINGKPVPFANQDDHNDTLKELAALLERRRSAFQRAMARVATPLPPSIRTSRASMLKGLTDRRDALRESVALAEQELADLTAEEAPEAVDA